MQNNKFITIGGYRHYGLKEGDKVIFDKTIHGTIIDFPYCDNNAARMVARFWFESRFT